VTQSIEMNSAKEQQGESDVVLGAEDAMEIPHAKSIGNNTFGGTIWVSTDSLRGSRPAIRDSRRSTTRRRRPTRFGDLDGWKEIGPTLTQRRAPLMSCPTWGHERQ